MKLISWNCQGLGNPRAVGALRELVKNCQLDFMFLMEALVTESRIEELRIKFDFHNKFCVHRIGRGCGHAAYWNQTCSCDVYVFSSNHIDFVFHNIKVGYWRLSCFYGYPERSRCKESWVLIRALASQHILPWYMYGDFNDLLFNGDKNGTALHLEWLLTGFREVITDCELSEIPLNGARHTWERCRGSSHWVQGHLDRAFALSSWLSYFPSCSLTAMVASISDHLPIVLSLSNKGSRCRYHCFKLKNAWLKEDGFIEALRVFLHSKKGLGLNEKLQVCTYYLQRMGRDYAMKFHRQIAKCKANLLKLPERVDHESVQSYNLSK